MNMSTKSTITSTHNKSCVIATSKIVGDKWTPILLFALADGNKRFCELQETGGINPRTLSARLDNLEAAGIIERTVFPEVPPRVEYVLTTKGSDLLPVIENMIAWADKHEIPCDKMPEAF
jgi:DNA-binding HxlR family transcriptional regulator